MKFNNNTLYYKEWFKNGIVFLGDVFKNGSFIPVKDIFSLLKTHWSKQNLIFDYARLRHAIPKAWLRHYGDGTLPTQRHDNVSLEIPCIYTGTKMQSKSIHDVTSNELLSLEEYDANRCCIYWNVMITDLNLDWTKIFKRNLLNCHENRLREFNFKLLYNYLANKNEFAWMGFYNRWKMHTLWP